MCGLCSRYGAPRGPLRSRRIRRGHEARGSFNPRATAATRGQARLCSSDVSPQPWATAGVSPRFVARTPPTAPLKRATPDPDLVFWDGIAVRPRHQGIGPNGDTDDIRGRKLQQRRRYPKAAAPLGYRVWRRQLSLLLARALLVQRYRPP